MIVGFYLLIHLVIGGIKNVSSGTRIARYRVNAACLLNETS
uniref:Uncharacterized protein n=1 Tax=Methylophaga nitratireducenticrescens TaxID=754476 RepID=I1XFG2_METNJ